MKTKTQARWPIYLILLYLLAVTAACARPSFLESPLPTDQLTAPLTAEDPTLPSPSLPPTSSSVSQTLDISGLAPTAAWTRRCRQTPDGLDAAFVSYKRSPAGPSLSPEAPFCYTWRVSNTGARPWPEGTMLIHVGGARFSAPTQVPVSSVAPGGMVDITLQLTAPPEEGHYATYWQLATPSGCPFGVVLYASFLVEAAQSGTEPPGPSVLPTTAVAPTNPPPTLEIPDFSVPGTCPTPEARFEPIVQQAEDLGLELGCASAGIETTSAHLQSFWRLLGGEESDLALRSLVLVRRDASHLIYVLEGWDAETREATPRTYDDTWEETEPEIPPACAPLVPPPGYISPTRSIGKAWCEHSLWNSIGWPREAEVPATLTLQPMTHGLLMEAITEDGIHWTIAIDLEHKSATVHRHLP